jgi:hypothetical protein
MAAGARERVFRTARRIAFSNLIGVAMTADHLLSADLVGRMWREAILLSFAFDYESATKVNLLDYFVREAMAIIDGYG